MLLGLGSLTVEVPFPTHLHAISRQESGQDLSYKSLLHYGALPAVVEGAEIPKRLKLGLPIFSRRSTLADYSVA